MGSNLHAGTYASSGPHAHNRLGPFVRCPHAFVLPDMPPKHGQRASAMPLPTSSANARRAILTSQLAALGVSASPALQVQQCLVDCLWAPP
ncbi:hypothetical protein CDD83_1218 [Cordyceps sp. RAO-2017]|nr:hypothetical protein CDD83_1218 [Cordyceps sp. RAO-2017]